MYFFFLRVGKRESSIALSDAQARTVPLSFKKYSATLWSNTGFTRLPPINIQQGIPGLDQGFAPSLLWEAGQFELQFQSGEESSGVVAKPECGDLRKLD